MSDNCVVQNLENALNTWNEKLAEIAALGFVSYHGMSAEQFLGAWFRSEILEPKRLCFRPNNYYYEILKNGIAEHEKNVDWEACT